MSADKITLFNELDKKFSLHEPTMVERFNAYVKHNDEKPEGNPRLSVPQRTVSYTHLTLPTILLV